MPSVIVKDGIPTLVDEGFLLASPEAVEADPPKPGTDPALSDPAAPTGAPAPASGEGQPQVPQAPSERETSTKPPDAAWDEWHRRQDAVRTMAREFDQVDHGDIREYVEGRTTRELTDEEVGQLLHDVTAQRVSDITDVLDVQLRSTSEKLKRSRRTVRVSAPRGWLRRAFNSLDERAAGQVAARLISRGHDTNTIIEKVVNRVSDEEARGRLAQAVEAGELKVEFSDIHTHSIPDTPADPQATFTPKDAIEFARAISEGIKAPNVNVEVVAGGGKKRIKRDAQGLVEEIEEE